MIDIDHFKSINDLYGHPTGDRVIQFLAHSMVANLRMFDIAGRLGGEEFVVILPETHADGAFALANRLREILESSDAVVSDAESGSLHGQHRRSNLERRRFHLRSSVGSR
jgi:diguanylate cyclase (GGDEF)-like protein